MFLFSLVYRFFSLCTTDVHAVFRAIHAGIPNFQAFLCTVLPKQKHPQPERRRCAEHYMQAVPRILKPLHSVLCGGFFFLRFPGVFHFSQIFHISAFRWFCNSTVSCCHSSITVPSQYCFITVSKVFQTVPLKFPHFPTSLSFCRICWYIIGNFCASCLTFGDFFAILPLVDRLPKV